MAIRIPTDALKIRDSRLDLIRIICTLHDQLVDDESNGLKAKVKASMTEKGAAFAESDRVVAALRAGTPKTSISARKLYALLKLDQFLDCVVVSKKPLEQHLSGAQIAQLETKGPAPAAALYTEFKEDFRMDVDAVASALLDAVAKLR